MTNPADWPVEPVNEPEIEPDEETTNDPNLDEEQDALIGSGALAEFRDSGDRELVRPSER